MVDYYKYIGHKVRVIDKDGEVYEGIMLTYEYGYEEDPEVDYDSIGIKPTGTQGYYIGIPIPDIEKFEVLD